MQQVTIIVSGMRGNDGKALVSAVLPVGVYPVFHSGGGHPLAERRAALAGGSMMCLPIGSHGRIPCSFAWPIPTLEDDATDYDRMVYDSRRRIYAAEIGRGGSGRAKLIVHDQADLPSETPYCILYAPLDTGRRGNIVSGDWSGDVQEVSGTVFRVYEPHPATIVSRGFHVHPQADPGQLGAQWMFLLPKGKVLRLDPTSGDQTSIYYLFDGRKLHTATAAQRKELRDVEGSPWPIVRPTEEAEAWFSRCRPYEGVSYPDMLLRCLKRMSEVEVPEDYAPQWDLLRSYHYVPQSALDALLTGDNRGAEKWVQEVVKHAAEGNVFGWPEDLVEMCKITRRITR